MGLSMVVPVDINLVLPIALFHIQTPVPFFQGFQFYIYLLIAIDRLLHLINPVLADQDLFLEGLALLIFQSPNITYLFAIPDLIFQLRDLSFQQTILTFQGLVSPNQLLPQILQQQIRPFIFLPLQTHLPLIIPLKFFPTLILPPKPIIFLP